MRAGSPGHAQGALQVRSCLERMAFGPTFPGKRESLDRARAASGLPALPTGQNKAIFVSLRDYLGGYISGMQRAMLAIAVLSCIGQPAAAASRSDTTAAEAIILYKGGDRDLMVYFLGLVAWANSYLQFTKAKQLFCGPLVLTNAQLFEALAGFVAKHPDAGELRMGNALLLSLQDAYPCP